MFCAIAPRRASFAALRMALGGLARARRVLLLRRVSRALLPLPLLLLPALSAPASAQVPRVAEELVPESRAPRLGRAILEATGALLIGTGWYWANTKLNSEDWELHWDMPSWRTKLSSDGMSFDTNAFDVNAVKHPFGTVFVYQAGRANGYGAVGSSVITLASSVVWEYVVEFKEVVSANDLIVNVASGLGLAEPLFQVGQYLRHGRATPARRVLGAIFSPFDGLHDWLDERPRLLGAPAWHRFRISAGRSVARFGDLERRELDLGLDLALARAGYVGRAVDHQGRTRAGASTRLIGRLSLGDAGSGTAFLGTRLRTQTSLIGYQVQRFSSPIQGWAEHVAIGAAFEYDTRRLPEAWDQVAAMHFVGPQLELTGYASAWTVRAELAAYADFTMMQAHVFDPFVPLETMPPYTSTLRSRGYYFGLGGTAIARVRAERPGWDVELEARELRAWSIDGFDRGERTAGAPPTPTGLTDQRRSASATIGLRPFDGVLGVTATVEGLVRRGTYRDEVRRTTELTAMFGLVLAL